MENLDLISILGSTIRLSIPLIFTALAVLSAGALAMPVSLWPRQAVAQAAAPPAQAQPARPAAPAQGKK